MIELPELNEPTMLHNLRTRFEEGIIYSCIGSILISVNPYTPVPIYGTEVMDCYSFTVKSTLPPHIYGKSSMFKMKIL